MVNSDEILFQQYKLYAEHKEKFIDRSFATNKFYLVLVLVIALTMFLTKDYCFAYGLSSILIFSAAGMAICILWWINMDSYNLLIKVKLSNVLEQIEKQLPIQPYTQEFSVVKDLRKNKREFLFSDMQKAFAILALLLFFVLFVNELVLVIFG